MPEAPVNDSGAVLYYEDTGAPEGSTDYLTVVLVHGLTFHGGAYVCLYVESVLTSAETAVYNRLLPYAAQHNLRLVRINMRDYPRSSRYTPEELAAFSDPDVNVQAAAIKAHGEEIAAFIEYFIKKYDIPKIKCVDGRKTGGLALLTWSMSNILAFAFLGNARYFAKSTQDLLAQYLRTVVLHGMDARIGILGSYADAMTRRPRQLHPWSARARRSPPSSTRAVQIAQRAWRGLHPLGVVLLRARPGPRPGHARPACLPQSPARVPHPN